MALSEWIACPHATGELGRGSERDAGSARREGDDGRTRAGDALRPSGAGAGVKGTLAAADAVSMSVAGEAVGGSAAAPPPGSARAAGEAWRAMNEDARGPLRSAPSAVAPCSSRALSMAALDAPGVGREIGAAGG